MKNLDMLRVYRYFTFIIVFSFVWLPVYAQAVGDTTSLKKEVFQEDQALHILDTLLISLSEVWLLPKLQIETAADRKEYLTAKRRVYKVYPFAVLAAERLEIIDELLEDLPNKRSQRVYLRRVQKFMQEEFSDTLKSFTRSEGRILFKLIHRQTGRTTFDLVKEYRNGWNAFWYNTAASAYDLSMKSTYQPLSIKEDYYIEDILQRAYGSGRLEEQDPAVPIDLKQMYGFWEIKE